MYETNGSQIFLEDTLGFFICFEVKRPNQPYKATEVQKLIIEQMIRSGAVHHASVIETVQEAISVLESIDKFYGAK